MQADWVVFLLLLLDFAQQPCGQGAVEYTAQALGRHESPRKRLAHSCRFPCRSPCQRLAASPEAFLLRCASVKSGWAASSRSKSGSSGTALGPPTPDETNIAGCEVMLGSGAYTNPGPPVTPPAHAVRPPLRTFRDATCRARRERHSASVPSPQFVSVHPTSLVQSPRSAGLEALDDGPQGQRSGEFGGAGAALTLYCCRFTTGQGRGSGLSDPCSAVNLCLIGADGRAVLHRLQPYSQQEAGAGQQISQGASPQPQGLGVDFTSSWGPPPASPPDPGISPGAVRRRFETGAVDEVSFLAPDLGPLAALLVGPESGSWALQELQVAASPSGLNARFVCQRLLGSEAGQGAAYLTPVPAGAVVYGSGGSARTLSQAQASSLRAASLSAYQQLKAQLLTATALLALAGAALSGLLAGRDAALPFALGGLAGCVYQWLLQQGVEGLVGGGDTFVVSRGGGGTEGGQGLHWSPALQTQSVLDQSASRVEDVGGAASPCQGNEPHLEAGQTGLLATGQTGLLAGEGGASVQQQQQQQPGLGAQWRGGGVLQRVAVSPGLRVGLVAGLGLAAASLLGGTGGESGGLSEEHGMVWHLVQPSRGQVQQLALGALGFMMYKVALVAVTVSSISDQGTQEPSSAISDDGGLS
ncbi:hypothetical protein V8C86DRAFT_1524294 [Haematococcus lacustris]